MLKKLKIPLVISIFLSVNAYAGEIFQHCVSQTNGNWNDSTTWSDCDGGIPNPSTGSVTIMHNVYLTSSVTDTDTLSIFINSGALYTGPFYLKAYSIDLNGGDLIGSSGTLIIGSGGSGSLSINNSDSDFIAPSYVNILAGERYYRYRGSSNWILNSSTLLLNNRMESIYELPPDTYSTLFLNALNYLPNGNQETPGNDFIDYEDDGYHSSFHYALKNDTEASGYHGSLHPSFLLLSGSKLSIEDKTLNVREIFNYQGASLSFTTGKLRSNKGIGGYGTFNPGQGTVELFGTEDAYVYGMYSFYNLFIDTSNEEGGKTVYLGKSNNKTITIKGNLNLNGAPGKPLTIQPLDFPPALNLVVSGDIVVGDYLNVSNCHVTGGTITTGSNSIDGGGNSGWIFGYPTPAPTTRPTLPPTADTTPTPDDSGPLGNININNDRRITTSRFVTLNLSATDDSPPIEMRFSNNGQNWTPWRLYKQTYKLWNITNRIYGGNARPGHKWVYVQYRDKLKNRSRTYIDRVKYTKKR